MTPPEPSAPLGPHLEDALSQKQLSSTWQRVQASRDAKAIRRARVRAGTAVLALCAVAVTVAITWPRSSGELLLEDGTALQNLEGAQSARLADASQIRTTPEGALDVLENSPTRMSLHLRRGAARFEVTPGTGRQWRVEAGETSVEVVGTKFVVAREKAMVRVSVEQGVVVVRGAHVPDGVRRLVAGEQLEVGPKTPPPAPAVVVAPPVAPAPIRPPRVASPPPEASEGATPALLLATADLARRNGQSTEAIEILSRVVARWPESVEAPLAAFTVANLLAESAQAEAAQGWYRRALELRLEEPLAEAARRALDAGAPR
jgi:tetratricopeptide (TPR) repeat protein